MNVCKSCQERTGDISVKIYRVHKGMIPLHICNKHLKLRQPWNHLHDLSRFEANQILAFRKLSSIYVFGCFPFGFEGRIWDLIVSVPDHCLSFYFEYCIFVGYTSTTNCLVRGD